jgi:thymidylate synthase
MEAMVISDFEYKYKWLLSEVLEHGVNSENRTGIATKKLFNQNIEINLNKGFPVVTGKKIFWEKALAEFYWIYSGRTDLEYLHAHNIFWWDNFAVENKLGKIYGYQIRNFNGHVDQIKYAIKEIKKGSRRAIITLWNPSELDAQALPCCYTLLNFVEAGGDLNLIIHFRSSDLFLGLPYDIIFGALMLKTISEQTGLKSHRLALNLADAHIYECHHEQIVKYLNTETFNLPLLSGSYAKGFILNNYKHGPYIKSKLVL